MTEGYALYRSKKLFNKIVIIEVLTYSLIFEQKIN